VTERDMFKLNYGFYLNLLFLAVTAGLGWLWWRGREGGHGKSETSLTDYILRTLSVMAMLWLSVGLLLGVAGYGQ